jgi:hypothetical protein
VTSTPKDLATIATAWNPPLWVGIAEARHASSFICESSFRRQDVRLSKTLGRPTSLTQ